ncbi:hypothetical protein FOXYSP1_19104 [Fusarium oxysporum f. sp. phaseoli]
MWAYLASTSTGISKSYIERSLAAHPTLGSLTSLPILRKPGIVPLRSQLSLKLGRSAISFLLTPLLC